METHVTYYTATSIIPPLYSLTILHHPVNSSFTSHIAHCVHRPQPRIFPATARTSYTFATLIRAYLTIALVYCTKEAIFPDDYYAFLRAIQQTQASHLVLSICLQTRRCSCWLLIFPFPNTYSTPALFSAIIRTTWFFFPTLPFLICDTSGISRLPHLEGEPSIYLVYIHDRIVWGWSANLLDNRLENAL